MSVRRGEPWGVEGTAPGGLVIAGSDAELHAILNEATGATAARPAVGLTGGDLWRTLGGAPGRVPPRPGAPVAMFTIDLGSLDIGERRIRFASHVIGRRRWWRGEIVAIMNAQYLGAWDVAPRSHPNDGRLDVLRVRPSMRITDRWKARSRLASGTHVPHPDIEQTRVTHAEMHFDQALDVTADGVRIGRHQGVTLQVLPDALTIVI